MIHQLHDTEFQLTNGIGKMHGMRHDEDTLFLTLPGSKCVLGTQERVLPAHFAQEHLDGVGCVYGESSRSTMYFFA